MIHLADTLRPQHVVLGLRTSSLLEATEQMAALLKGDERVLDWASFREALVKEPMCRVDDQIEFGVCIPHVRTGAVGEMVLTAGRWDTDMPLGGCAKPIRYIFAVGVPQALASDYLRLAGLLVRIMTDREVEGSLRNAKTGADFVRALESLETKL